jgi:hypothetical protein
VHSFKDKYEIKTQSAQNDTKQLETSLPKPNCNYLILLVFNDDEQEEMFKQYQTMQAQTQPKNNQPSLTEEQLAQIEKNRQAAKELLNRRIAEQKANSNLASSFGNPPSFPINQPQSSNLSTWNTNSPSYGSPNHTLGAQHVNNNPYQLPQNPGQLPPQNQGNTKKEDSSDGMDVEKTNPTGPQRSYSKK